MTARLIENELQSVVKDCVNQVLQETRNQINEGLIMSYPFEICKNYLHRKFQNIQCICQLKNIPYKRFNRTVIANNNDFYAIALDCADYSNYTQIIETANNLLGWFTGYIKIDKKTHSGYIPYRFYNFNNTFVSQIKNKGREVEINLSDFLKKEGLTLLRFDLIVEAKFSDVYHQAPNEFFYHLTNKDKLEKIMRQGLAPRSEGSFPERIYLGKKICEIADMVDIDYCDIVVLKVNVSDVKLFKLYRDQRNATSVYTYDNIPPSQIEILT